MRKQGNRRRKPFKQRSTNRSSGMSQITKMPFQDLINLTFTASGTLQTIEIAPTNTSLVRFNSVSKLFEFYRVVSLVAKVFPYTDTTTATNQIFAVAYNAAISGVTDITSFAEAAEVIPNVLITTATSTPQVLRVNRRLLTRDMSQVWFACGAAASLQEVTQGHLHIVPLSSSTTTFMVSIVMNIEFSHPTAATSKDLMISSSQRIYSKSNHVKGCQCRGCLEPGTFTEK
jgi:hypothetical protein